MPVKALFMFLDKDTPASVKSTEYVDINPNELNIDASITPPKETTPTNSTEAKPIVQPATSSAVTVSMQLYFDLVNKSYTDTNFEASILKHKCYAALEQAAQQQHLVAFGWGGMLYVGTISRFNAKLMYFSYQGVPLRAQVNLTITTVADEKILSAAKSNYSSVWAKQKQNSKNQRPAVIYG